MGSINFSADLSRRAPSGGRVIVEIHAEGDPYGHDGCDSADCHWTPEGYETLYMDVAAAEELRRKLDDAIKQAKKTARK